MKFLKKERDMTNAPLLPGLLSFGAVVLITNLFQLLFNTADLVVVGKFAGNDCLGAVGAASPLIVLLINLFIGFSVGITVVCSHDYGSGDKKGFREAVGCSIVISLIAGLVLTVLGIIFARGLLILMGTPEEFLEMSASYVKIYFIAMPATLFINYAGAAIRSVGNTSTPMITLSVGGVVNVILNLLLVIVFHLNVSGVAIATVVSQYVSAYLMLRHMLSADTPYKLTKDIIKIFPDKLRRIVKIAVPNCIYSIVICSSNVLIQSSLNTLGTAAVTGSSAASSIESYLYQFQAAMHTASMTFVGQNYGAGKYERIRKIQRISFVTVISSCIILGIAIYSGGETLQLIFIKEGEGAAEAIRCGMTRMLCIIIPYFLCGIIEVQTGVLNGLGQVVVPSIICGIGFCGVRVLWVATVFNYFGTAISLFACYPVSWLLSSIGLTVYYYYVKKERMPELDSYLEPNARRIGMHR